MRGEPKAWYECSKVVPTYQNIFMLSGKYIFHSLIISSHTCPYTNLSEIIL